jgi:predicted O-methyltransferase YrrM
VKLSTLWPSILIPRLRVWTFQKRFPEVPWLTEAAVYFLDSWLRPSDKGIEWGSGRSTVWLAARVGSLLSIEHDEQWSRKVRDMLQEKGLHGKVQCFHRPLDETYEDAARTVAEESLDFALVDGRRRLSCTTVVIPKIRPGGILILDDAERYIANETMGVHSTVIRRRDQNDPQWALILNELSTWRSVLTTSRICDTRIWVKLG